MESSKLSDRNVSPQFSSPRNCRKIDDKNLPAKVFTAHFHMSAEPTSQSENMFRDIGDIAGTLDTAEQPKTSEDVTKQPESSGDGGVLEDDEDSEAELEQGEPEAFVMNQVSSVMSELP